MPKKYADDGQTLVGSEEQKSYKKLLGKYYSKVFDQSGQIIVDSYEQAQKVTDYFKKKGHMDKEAAIQLLKDILTKINKPRLQETPKVCTPLRDLFKRDKCN
jgi:polyhydroxyalkanoate synthesis regulator phasin